MQGKITIAFGRCKACLLCMEVCAKNAIRQGAALNAAGYVPVEFDESAGCNGCALCGIRCPDAAIEVFRGE